MKRQPRLTKKERKALQPPRPAAMARTAGDPYDPTLGAIPPSPEVPAGSHLHCVACGKHLDTAGEARDRAAKGLKSNVWMSIRCAHGSEFYACMGCLEKARAILDEHDRTGQAPRVANAWH
jgi:hypothetical protein